MQTQPAGPSNPRKRQERCDVAAGGVIGKFAKHKVDSGLESGMGDKLKPGTAAIIAMVDEKDHLAAERALSTPAKSVAPMDKKGVRGLKGALAEAAGKFTPDCTDAGGRRSVPRRLPWARRLVDARRNRVG